MKHRIVHLAGCVVVAAASVVSAQSGYTFEMRLISDEAAGSPGGPTPALTYPLTLTTTRVGFWLQARVSQTVGQNYGIGCARYGAANSATAASFIAITNDSEFGGSSMQRGVINTAGTQHGRGTNYRNAGANLGPASNTGVAAFPGMSGAENGGLDGGLDATGLDRIYSFDAQVSLLRVDPDADGDGEYHSPFGINGGSNFNIATSDTTPVAPGMFSPWANLYRFYLDLSHPLNGHGVRSITISASATLFGFDHIAPVTTGSDTYTAALGPGTPMTTTWSYFVPTPSSACVLMIAGGVSSRRIRVRRR